MSEIPTDQRSQSHAPSAPVQTMGNDAVKHSTMMETGYHHQPPAAANGDCQQREAAPAAGQPASAAQPEEPAAGAEVPAGGPPPPAEHSPPAELAVRDVAEIQPQPLSPAPDLRTPTPAPPNEEPARPAAGSAEAAAEPAAPAAPAAPAIHIGRVTRLTAEKVFVELDEARGTVPLIEFAGQPLPKDGDEVSVIIEGEDPQTGLLALSKRQADEAGFWESIQPGDVVEGVVTGMNKGGLDVDLGGARAFLPASQVDTQRVRDISMLIGEHVKCVVSQVDRTTRDLVLSRRKLIERERKEQRAAALKSLTEGELRTGTVSSITDFGAFVSVGGVDGLVHITDMSWGRIKHPGELVQVGQEIEVRVLKVDRRRGKVSLSLREATPDPWTGIEDRYQKGMRVRAEVLRLADFGAFLELEPGVDALLPVSEMSWSRRVTSPSEVVKVGDSLELVVLKVDPDKKRISVGLKQTEENPWSSAETRFPVDSTTRGKVSRVMEYGAFVEVTPGVEGLVHISELSDRRVAAVTDVVQEGQEVEVRVIKIDPQAQRISLSMRPKPPERRAGPQQEETKGKSGKPARKRPLRGGLASHFEW